jgi:hypothetical protein
VNTSRVSGGDQDRPAEKGYSRDLANRPYGVEPGVKYQWHLDTRRLSFDTCGSMTVAGEMVIT